MSEQPTTVGRALRRLEDFESVSRRIAMKRTWIYGAISAGKFPAPIKIGTASRWDSAAVDAWIADRVAQASGEQPS